MKRCDCCKDEIFYYDIAVAFVKLLSQQEVDDYQDGISIKPEQYMCHRCVDAQVGVQ